MTPASDLKAYFVAALGISVIMISALAWPAKTIIVHPPANTPKESLVLEVLKLAIQKSGYGQNYSYEAYREELTEARMMSLLNDGTLNIMWAGTQPKYENQLHPIRIPILKGMLGHRIFIIRQGDQARFDSINSLSELQQIPLGQGRFWGDTVILKNAGMKVVAPVKYVSLFPMLEGGRFDFFPRAVHEPWSEVAAWSELPLTVEKNILLIYPFAMYFFVSHENKKFGRIVEDGFLAAVVDGSFDEMFFNHPMIKDALGKANLKNRKIFRLQNPTMSPETPTNRHELWLNVEGI